MWQYKTCRLFMVQSPVCRSVLPNLSPAYVRRGWQFYYSILAVDCFLFKQHMWLRARAKAGQGGAKIFGDADQGYHDLRLRLHGPPGRFVKEGAQQDPSLVHKEGVS